MSTQSIQKLKVCVIGGGPGAMFLCHAWNRQRRDAEQQGRRLPYELQVTCFERNPSPGGIWRAIRTSSTTDEGVETSVNDNDNDNHDHGDDLAAYDELWTNGPCHCLEFYDYTFDEHFDGVPVPVYLPRRDITEYLIGRVTKDAPTFFEDYFQCNTEVVRVQQVKNSNLKDDTDASGDKKNFQVFVRNTITGQVAVEYFDKCVWAAGENGQRSIPQSLQALFTPRMGRIMEPLPTRSATTTILPDTVAEEKKQTEDDFFRPSGMDSSSTTIPLSQKSPIQLFHSTETQAIRKHIQQRKHPPTYQPSSRVLLIGGALSAEDLALQCLKWGANHVHIAARGSETEVSWTTLWPENRVTLHEHYRVQSVDWEEEEVQDGSSHALPAIHLEKVRFVWPHNYEPDDEKDPEYEGDPIVTVRGVDMVVFCTGYQANLSMLDEALIPAGCTVPQYCTTMDPSMRLDMDPAFDWDAWKMNSDQPAFPFTGDVPAGQGIMIRANYNHPDMHRGIFFRNPHMMFLCQHGSDVPLLSIDIHAWLLCSYLTGRIPMPSVAELQEANRQQVLDQLHLPSIRCMMDQAYAKVLDDLNEDDDDSDDDDKGPHFWPRTPDDEECEYYKAEEQYENYALRLLARIMMEGQYPGKSLGRYEQLNETGLAMIDFGNRSYYQRTDLQEQQQLSSSSHDDDGSSPIEWRRTFRDDTIEPPNIYSLYTGTKARPLKQLWMDIHGPTHSVKNGI